MGCVEVVGCGGFEGLKRSLVDEFGGERWFEEKGL